MTYVWLYPEIPPLFIPCKIEKNEEINQKYFLRRPEVRTNQTE